VHVYFDTVGAQRSSLIREPVVALSARCGDWATDRGGGRPEPFVVGEYAGEVASELPGRGEVDRFEGAKLGR
jgi:hypothetical protein